MKAEAFLSAMEELAERLGIKLSYEDLHKGEVTTHGALFKLRGAKRIIIHKGLTHGERGDLLAEILACEDLDSMHLAPQVRSRLEKTLAHKDDSHGSEGRAEHA